ncbi:hypothetical protein [Thalassomonas sp. RHCl1]|uniref:hypothetical protein n=1 Tax=Thalassomonas sp. RHCl1 TaxID=2995320 RepID=UPI00248D2C6A|nr:hypothetical protein [Thalassomonas sp. RHCl1]
MNSKFTKWIIFSVLLALIPLISNYAIQLTFDFSPTITSILQKGELSLITVALCATAIGELVASGNQNIIEKLVFSGLCILILIFSAIYFTAISMGEYFVLVIDGRNTQLISFEANHIRNISLFIYCCALVSSGACIRLSGEQRNVFS